MTLLHCCFQEKRSGALPCSGERNWCTTVLKDKETGVLLFLVEGNRCFTVFKRRDLVLYCFQEKENGALLFSRICKMVHIPCFQEKGTGSLEG